MIGVDDDDGDANVDAFIPDDDLAMHDPLDGLYAYPGVGHCPALHHNRCRWSDDVLRRRFADEEGAARDDRGVDGEW